MTIDDARSRRAAKASALVDLKNGRLNVRTVVLRPPQALHTTDLWYVLIACPGIGRVRARTVCENARVFPMTPLGKLSVPQRRAVAAELV